MKTLKELFERLLEPTPAFFATLRKLAATIVLISGLVIGIEKAGYDVPDFITKALNFYTATSALIAVFITSLASIWRNEDGSINEAKKEKYIAEKLKELEDNTQ